jgi:hypothetical protein
MMPLAETETEAALRMRALAAIVERETHADPPPRSTRTGFGRTIDLMLPLLLGIIIGALSTFAALAGSIATLQADSREYRTAIGELRAARDRDALTLQDILSTVQRLGSDAAPTPHTRR